MDRALSRQALYEMIWSEPLKSVAQRLGVPEKDLKKACVAGNIPLPVQHQWARAMARAPASRSPLPPRSPGANEVLRIGEPDFQASQLTPEAQLAQPLPTQPNFDEPLERVRARSVKRLGEVRYVQDLTSPWAGLRQPIQEDRKRIARQRAEKSKASWNQPLFESGFEKRRLKVLNSLGLGLAKVRARLEVRGKSGRDVSVVVGDTRVLVRLDHPSAEPDKHGEWHVRPGPADSLRLLIGPKTDRAEGYQAVWEDTADGLIKDLLSDIALEIVVAGEAEFRAEAARAHARQLHYREQLAQTLERRRTEGKTKSPAPPISPAAPAAPAAPIPPLQPAREHLFAQAAEWRTAQDVRGFVAAVLAQPSTTQAPQALRAWANWALAEADAIDPTMSEAPA